MTVLEGILGPAQDQDNIGLDIPDCVKIQTPEDAAQMKAFGDSIVKATTRNAVRVLRQMLAVTPNAIELGNEFAQRLGVD